MYFRKFLYPFSILYDGITRLRNHAYDKGWKSSSEYETPIISVGNLSVGGTGKSPMVEYLVRFLKNDYQLAVLSRGYKRKSKGFHLVESLATSEQVGDEPLQIKRKFPDITVAVCADRREGIAALNKAELIILDDAFQHRKVTPALSILLSSFDQLYLEDHVLPAGNLRESRKSAKRADVLIVTKCPENVSYAKLQEIQFRMRLLPHQQVYFTKIGYADYLLGDETKLPLSTLKDKKFTLVTGIAKPAPLVSFLKTKGFDFTHEKFPDHHHFSEKEIASLQKEQFILTTEKDYQRLADRIDGPSLYYLPIETLFLNESGEVFQKDVLKRLLDFRMS